MGTACLHDDKLEPMAFWMRDFQGKNRKKTITLRGGEHDIR